jgi:hypothetical protein
MPTKAFVTLSCDWLLTVRGKYAKLFPVSIPSLQRQVKGDLGVDDIRYC